MVVCCFIQEQGKKQIMMLNLSKLIDIIAGHQYDAEAICIQLAKLHPDVFVQLAEQTHEVNLPDWVRGFVYEIRHGGFISSIKMLREHTGLNLKEAKETVENLINYRLHTLEERSFYTVADKPIHHLDRECSRLYDLVCMGFRRYP